VQYDVIIVGAGPAGSVAAYECAKSGFTTALLEKYSLPREKPCGGAVMYHGLRLIKERIPHSLIERKIYGLRFVLSHGKEAEFVSEKLIGITTMRTFFDEFLAKRAVRKGAELHEKARVVKVTVDQNCANVILQNGTTFKSLFVIGADGVNSVVSRSLGLRPARKDLTKVGLGMESDVYVGEEGVLQAMNNQPTILEILPVENTISYGWIFPKREHLGIGIAGASVFMRHLRPVFDGFCKSIEKRIRMDLTIKKRRTYFLGGDGLNSKNIASRAILVGDAAGFVDPMMGEGIAYAMKSAKFAAQIISEALNQGRYDEEFLSAYQNLCIKEFSQHFGMASRVGHNVNGFGELILSKANGHKFASEIMAMIARGELKYSQIPYTILKRLPKEIPSIIRHIVQSRIEHYT
jgi:geranylgeranyl reductase family protein